MLAECHNTRPVMTTEFYFYIEFSGHDGQQRQPTLTAKNIDEKENDIRLSC